MRSTPFIKVPLTPRPRSPPRLRKLAQRLHDLAQDLVGCVEEGGEELGAGADFEERAG